MKCLILGAKGFVASHLIPRLKKRGYIVIEFNRGSKFPKEKVDVVFHLAANSSIMTVVKDPSLAKENYDITHDLLEWMRKTKTPKIVFTSSREVYSLENMYGVSKKLSEEVIQEYSKLYGIKYAILRMTNLYGAEDHLNRFIPLVIGLAKQNKEVTIFGEHKLLNFVYIDDCIDSLIKATRMNGIFNLNSPESVTLKHVASTIISLLHSKSKMTIKPEREGETKQYKPRSTPFKLKVSLEEGLKKIC